MFNSTSIFYCVTLLYCFLFVSIEGYAQEGINEETGVELSGIELLSSVSVNNGTPESTGSNSITFPAPSVQTGDILIVQIVVAEDFIPSNVLCPPQGWISLIRNDYENKVVQEIFFYIARSDQPAGSYTWNFKTNRSACGSNGAVLSGKGASGGLLHYTGVDPDDPVDTFAGAAASGSATTATAPSVTTTTDNTQLVHFFGAFKDLNFTTTNSRIYTVGSSTNSAERTAAAYHRAQESSGNTSAFTVNLSSSAEWISATLALRPLSSSVKLSFNVQPSNTTRGAIITPAVEVAAVDENDNILSSFDGMISVSIGSNPGNGTLQGTVQKNALNGIAIFNDLSIDNPGTGYTLRATASTMSSVTSEPFNIIDTADTILVIISGNNQEGFINTSLGEPFVIEVRNTQGDPVSGVPIEFAITEAPQEAEGQSLTVTSGITGSNGRLATTLTMGDKSGLYRVAATSPVSSGVVFNATVPAYSISGGISHNGSPLPEVNVIATGGHRQTVTTGANGNYLFTNVPAGAREIVLTPAKDGYNFTPLSLDIPGPVTGNITNQNFTAAILTFTISGKVTKNGSPLGGVTIDATGGHTQSVTTNSNGIYTLTNVRYGTSSITVTPTLQEHNFSPTIRTINGPVTGDVTDIDFIAIVEGYTISGTIRDNGEALAGVTVTASGGFTQVVSTDAGGKFVVSGIPGGTDRITITPTHPGYGFIPANILILGPVNNNIVDVDFTATQVTYTLSGRVMFSGLGLKDVTITAQGGHSGTVVTDENGEYIFTDVAHGARDIFISPELTGYGFTPASITVPGPVEENKIINEFTAQVLNYSISGIIIHVGAGLQDVTVTASGEYTNSVQTGSNGRYEFTNIPFGTRNITIIPEKTGYLFSPDKSTISGPIIANLTNINFNTEPPPSPTLLSPLNNATEQLITLTLSWNEVSGATRYGLEISRNASFSGTPVLFISNLETTSYEIQNLDRGQTYYWRVYAENLGGTGPWSAAWSFTTTFVQRLIQITSPAAGDVWKEGDVQSIRWESQAVDHVDIAYSSDDGISWNNLASSLNAGSKIYLWTIPGIKSTECRIKVSDSSDDMFFTVSDPFSIYQSTVPVNHTLTFSDPGSISSYRMVGLPGNGNLHLSQLIPGIPNKDWTAFHDNGQTTNYLHEYDGSTIFTFKPGTGFWLLSKNGISIQNQVESVSLNTDNTFSIPLHTGWNIISNPFDLTVPWDDVKEINDITESIWGFEGRYSTSEVLEPYNGYYFFNHAGDVSLKIPYPSGNSSPKISGKTNPDLATLSLSLMHNGQASYPVRIHYLEELILDSDGYRKYAPPGDFEEAGIYIRNPEVSTAYKYFSEDAVVANGKGNNISIELFSHSDKPVDLLVHGLEFFDGYDIILIDRNTGRKYELQNNVLSGILTGKGKREFTLLIGTGEYMTDAYSSILPREFHLSDNYPNPFNPETTIDYSIPESHRMIPVVIEVYNVLGQKVRMLVDEIQNAGFYSVRWDGRNDHGYSVASGLYIYTIRAGNFTDRKSMIYLR
jgi:hypothetical protein